MNDTGAAPQPVCLPDPARPIRVGVWNFYEELTQDGYIFKNTNAGNGHNLLKPWCDLYAYGQSVGLEFYTLDQVSGPEALDAIIFLDRPRSNRPQVEALMSSPIKKYLVVYESALIKPDNYEMEFRNQFDRIFTWDDTVVDGYRHLKSNFVSDPKPPIDFSVLKDEFGKRKLCTIIAGAKAIQHPNELYSHRVRAIRWFESQAAHDFDLYGIGWDAASFPSYRGAVSDKLMVLSGYRFSLCYENAMNYPGYITEKIQDCLLAGVVPLYGGAPNVSQWIPSDCYVDIGQFGDYFELYEFMSKMDAETHAGYLNRIEKFLSSPQFYPFSIECFINTVVSVLSHDVRKARGEYSGVSLVQRQPSMLLEELSDSDIPHFSNRPATVVEKAKPSLPDRESFASLSRPDLVVYFGYGNELPVFMRARALWEFYISHFPGIEAVFVRETEQLAHGEIVREGGDLLVGIGGYSRLQKKGGDGYASSGNWSSVENERQIYRQISFYDYLLRTRDKPFYLYQSTITSVIDFRGLLAALELMPKERCYAGMPGSLAAPEELRGLTFVCGTNSLLSSDILREMRDKYNPEHINAAYPNDIWQALTLKDTPRIALPFCNFTEPRALGSHLDEIRSLTRKYLKAGHYHFRVKTSSFEAGMGRREDVDPWVMLKVMEEILNTPVAPEATHSLLRALATFCNAGPDGIAPFTNESMFSAHRGFPLTEAELVML